MTRPEINTKNGIMLWIRIKSLEFTELLLGVGPMLNKLSCCNSFPTSGTVSTASSVQLRTLRLRGVYVAQTCNLSTQETEAGGLL